MCLEQTKFHNFAARPWRGASSRNFFTGAFPPAQMRGRSVQGLMMLQFSCHPSCVKAQKTPSKQRVPTRSMMNPQKDYSKGLFLQSCWEFGLLLVYSMHICDISPKHMAKHHSSGGGAQSLCQHTGEVSKAGWGDYTMSPSAWSPRL